MAIGGDGVQDADAFPGWIGDTYNSRGNAYDLHTLRSKNGRVSMKEANPNAIDPDRVVQVSWKPRAFLYKNFLSESECDHLVSLAEPKLQPSTVAATINSESVLSEIRTSWGMFVEKSQTDIVKKIEERLAAWTFLPVENGEALQILRYNHGQKYDAHYDFFGSDAKNQRGGDRYATVLMYLSNVIRGGETVFPNSKSSQTYDDSWSDCSKEGVAVKPDKGDALLFFSLNPDGSSDSFSMHAACPVLEGVKWSATKWIHVGAFDAPIKDPSICEDEDDHCKVWAQAGECEKNAVYMVGVGNQLGSCRRACGVCKPKAPVVGS